MEFIAQDENAMGSIGSSFGLGQVKSVNHESLLDRQPLGKSSRKNPGRKAFGNITNAAGPSPQLSGKLSEKNVFAKQPRKAFGDITNRSSTQRDEQQAAKLSRDPAVVDTVSDTAPPSTQPRRSCDDTVEHLAGMSWQQQEKLRLASRPILLGHDAPTSILAPFLARHLPPEDLSLTEWARRYGQKAQTALEEVPPCFYVEPPSPGTWSDESIKQPSLRCTMPDLD